MKKILLTNFNIVNFSGSEIDTITIAKYFVDKNYEVDIFTLKFDEPLKSYVDEKINVITPNNLNSLKKNYDLIWAHHYPLLDYLIFEQNVKAYKIIYVSLSSIEPYEALPDYYDELSLICVMSEKTKVRLIDECSIKKEIYIFPNYASNKFFEEKITYKDEIHKICVISNHVPDEILDFKNIAQENNIIVDIYGMNHTIKFVDENLLREYDVIISIGKTMFYSIAMGKPSYCYDRFGGYGYIVKDNIEKCYKRNFSGRGNDTTKTASQIYEEIVSGFKYVQNDLQYNKEFANEYFCFEDNMEKILHFINNCKDVSFEKIISKYPLLKRKSQTHIIYMNVMYNQINNLNNKIAELEQKVIIKTNENIMLKQQNESLINRHNQFINSRI